MSENNTVYDRFFVLTQEDTIAEIRSYLQQMYEDKFPYNDLATIEGDIVALFHGDYPGYRSSTTSYHDLPHTLSVYLAVARLFHGAFLAGADISAEAAFSGLAAALMHDVGLIQTADDTNGTGAKYTQGHEQRSIEFAQRYFSRPDRDMPAIHMSIVRKAIACTILSLDPSEVEFNDDQCKLIAYSVGASDLYAQMADRAYLEKLILLYDEFTEANIPGYNSPLELLQKTPGFWEFLVKPRIQDKMDNIGDYFMDHFEQSIGRRENLYLSSILNHLEYLKTVLEERENDYREMLRRTSELLAD
ncbi:MAG: hypothetical protein D6B26_04040 [Spirochaetaceae bacterium]|nr:MAG: hypothetical protein D6B26_04040 [Spirochaetaceae bacterium]